ncbi:MAG: dihydrolipoamide acetyltransferase family protein [Pseudomonadota bacterium]
MKTFNLPDLGEGLPDAEIVEWMVAEGDTVKLDQPIVSMETAKAVVEVPSPYDGTVVKLHGGNGDVINTGAPLVDFAVEGETVPAPADQEADHTDAPTQPSAEDDHEDNHNGQAPSEAREDAGTVVGSVSTKTELLKQQHSTVGGVKVTPAVRALARKLKVNLAEVEPSGPDGVVTSADVRTVAASGPTRKAASPAKTPDQPAPAAPRQPVEPPSGEWQPLRGTRRTMARAMSESHARIVPTTIMDDADIHAWRPREDITARLLRALWVAAQSEPGLNAWYDDEQNVRMVHKEMHVGMAVDTDDGLFVAALRNVHSADRQGLRNEINRLRDNAKSRSIPPEDLKGYTIMLSNFGVFAGRYATPIINPPCVSIVAAGVLRHEVVPVMGGMEVHRMMPLSLTFDHRVCTGGEAARFLKAMIEDLAQPE